MKRIAGYLCAFAMVIALPAAAQEAPKPLGETLTGAAKTDYDIGRILFRDGDYEGARVKFQSAYEKTKEPRLLFNLAACARYRNAYGLAMRLVEQYKHDADKLLTDEDRKEADAIITGLKPFVAPLSITVNEVGASIYVDDELMGTSPLSAAVPIEFRKHKIHVVKEGYEPFDQELEVADATGKNVEVTLVKPEGVLVVVAGAGDMIVVDGTSKEVGRVEVRVPYGDHHVVVTHAGFVPYKTDATVRDHGVHTINVTLHKEKAPLPAWVWIGGTALLAVGAGIGGYFIYRGVAESFTATAGTLGTANFATGAWR